MSGLPDTHTQRLLELAIARLMLYRGELGKWYDALLENKEMWPVGYNRQVGHYWVAPMTKSGAQLPPPFGVFKWDGDEFRAVWDTKLKERT